MDILGKPIRAFGEFLALVGTRHQDHTGLAVINLPGDLWSGQGGVNRDVDRLGQLNGQIADNPFVAIFRDLNDSIAGTHTGLHEDRRGFAHVVSQFVPGDRDELSVLFDPQRGP